MKRPTDAHTKVMEIPPMSAKWVKFYWNLAPNSTKLKIARKTEPNVLYMCIGWVHFSIHIEIGLVSLCALPHRPWDTRFNMNVKHTSRAILYFWFFSRLAPHSPLSSLLLFYFSVRSTNYFRVSYFACFVCCVRECERCVSCLISHFRYYVSDTRP